MNEIVYTESSVAVATLEILFNLRLNGNNSNQVQDFLAAGHW